MLLNLCRYINALIFVWALSIVLAEERYDALSSYCQSPIILIETISLFSQLKMVFYLGSLFIVVI